MSDRKVIPFPRQSPTPKVIGFPSDTTLQCDDGTIRFSPEERTVESVIPFELPPAGAPTVFYDEHGNIMLDLGDCTTVRTLLRFTPEMMREWSRVFREMADGDDG